jgi:hypothetical protein
MALFPLRSMAFPFDPCPIRISQFAGVSPLVHKIVLVTPDETRETRGPDNKMKLEPTNLESAQGRLWCVVGQPVPPANEVPNIDNFKHKYHLSSENAVLVFDSGTILVARHELSPNPQLGGETPNVKNCYFEHLQSGDLYRLVKAKYKRRVIDKDVKFLNEVGGDLALAKLEKPVPGVTAVQQEDMNLDETAPESPELSVISNITSRKNPVTQKIERDETPTIDHCNRIEADNCGAETLQNVYQTDCNTSKGSSNSEVWSEDPKTRSPKLVGIISGGYTPKSMIDSTGYQSCVLSTVFVHLGPTLLELRDELNQK